MCGLHCATCPLDCVSNFPTGPLVGIRHQAGGSQPAEIFLWRHASKTTTPLKEATPSKTPLCVYMCAVSGRFLQRWPMPLRDPCPLLAAGAAPWLCEPTPISPDPGTTITPSCTSEGLCVRARACARLCVAGLRWLSRWLSIAQYASTKDDVEVALIWLLQRPCAMVPKQPHENHCQLAPSHPPREW